MNEQQPDRWEVWTTRAIRIAGIAIGVHAGLVTQNTAMLGLAITMMLGGVGLDSYLDARREKKE